MAIEDTEAHRHVSELPTARERFLARIVDQAFDDGWRSPEDFLRHFPPGAIVESLAPADAIRVKLLVEATGAKERIALKKSIASAAEDLALALEEGIATPAQVLGLYAPDDKVRYLPADALWRFYAEDEFFTIEKSRDPAAHARAVARTTFAIEVALDEKLLTLKDVADGITFDEIAKDLPVEDLRDVVKHAMQLARANAPLSEERFHAVVPLAKLVSYVPLAHTWSQVILEKVGTPAGFCAAIPSRKPDDAAAAPTAVSRPAASPAAPAPVPPPPAPPSPAAAAPLPAPPFVPAIPPPPARPSGLAPTPALAAPEAPGGSELDVPVTVEAPAGGERPVEEDEARRGVLERLEAMERLPPTSDTLPTPVLLSIESMYVDLGGAVTDEEREVVIEDAFPNEGHLRTAMLALIGLLDPSVNTADPVIRDGDSQSLVKLVVFEERKRAEPWRSASASSAPSASGARRRSIPPPIPRSAPPPAVEGRRAKRP